MRCIKTTVLVTCATVLLTAGFASAQDTSSRVTRMTFTAPVELPGVTLPAGTYTFRLADPKGDGGRHIVQILDEKDEKIVATVMAMPARRLKTEEVNVVTFREEAASAGKPSAIRFWYYPNDIMGQEFAYPKERALALAAATRESVLAVEGEQITRIEAEAAAVPPPTQPEVPVTPPTPDVPVAAPETPTVGTAGRLPTTASELPLIGLIGLLALGGALLTRALRVAL
jgi:hypothetical protein